MDVADRPAGFAVHALLAENSCPSSKSCPMSSLTAAACRSSLKWTPAPYEHGPQEVGSFEGTLSPYLMWCGKILLDVVGSVASMFAIVTAAAEVTNAVGLFDDLFPAVGQAAQQAQGRGDIARACSAILNILKGPMG